MRKVITAVGVAMALLSASAQAGDWEISDYPETGNWTATVKGEGKSQLTVSCFYKGSVGMYYVDSEGNWTSTKMINPRKRGIDLTVDNKPTVEFKGADAEPAFTEVRKAIQVLQSGKHVKVRGWNTLATTFDISTAKPLELPGRCYTGWTW